MYREASLVSAGVERQNHAFVVDAMAEHIKIMLHALDQLEQHGFAFPERRITVLTREDRAALGDRIVAMLGGAVVARAPSSIRTTTTACAFR
jgi:3-phenylpropionate/cinnamic acid dioxygenase small subunit